MWFSGLHPQHDRSGHGCRSEMKTEIQERKCSGWHLLCVKLCSQACHWKWRCGHVKLGWHFQSSGYFWQLFHHGWSPASLSSIFSIYVTVPLLFLLAVNNSLILKFSGEACCLVHLSPGFGIPHLDVILVLVACDSQAVMCWLLEMESSETGRKGWLKTQQNWK